jgi:hypothetical protein
MGTSSRFDQLARDLARTSSRRKLLSLALAGAAGLFGAMLGRGTAEAAIDICRLHTTKTWCKDSLSYYSCVDHKTHLCPLDSTCKDLSTGAFCKHIA